MSESTQREWRTLCAAAMSEVEDGQLGPMIEDAEEAIQQRLREVMDSVSVFEESELYAALRVLRRVRSQLLTAA